jgi:hypothetical protein
MVEGTGRFDANSHVSALYFVVSLSYAILTQVNPTRFCL